MTQRAFLITGASKGIGRALSERLVRKGHRVVGLARTERNKRRAPSRSSSWATDFDAAKRNRLAVGQWNPAMRRQRQSSRHACHRRSSPRPPDTLSRLA